MTVEVNVYEAKTHLSKLIEQVLAGERVVISKSGTPVADLVAHQTKPIKLGALKGKIRYDDSVFDVDPEINAMFYGDA